MITCSGLHLTSFWSNRLNILGKVSAFSRWPMAKGGMRSGLPSRVALSPRRKFRLLRWKKRQSWRVDGMLRPQKQWLALASTSFRRIFSIGIGRRRAFDVVVGIFIQFAGPAERPAQMAGMKQAVKPGGLLLLQGYTPKQLEFRTGGPSAVENLYTSTMLRALFADWEIISLREHEDTIAEGNAHVGRSALIDLVARKPTDR
jgi:hypothetical protein